MSKAQVIFHIGTHKTQTTVLQYCFYHNAEALKLNGIFYPTDFTFIDDNYHEGIGNGIILFNDIKYNQSIKQKKLVESVLKMAMNHGRVLISAEEFWCIKDKASFFNQFETKDTEVKVVVYLRRQDYYVQSLHNQITKHGTNTLKNYDINNYIDSEWIFPDYEKELDSISKVVNKKNIIVRPYEKGQIKSNDILEDFLCAVEIEGINNYVMPDKNINPTLTRDFYEIKRLFNKSLYEAYPFIEIEPLFTMFSQQQEKEVTIKKNLYSIFSPKFRLELIEKYSEGNAKIAREYLGRPDGQLFYEDLPNTLESWQELEVNMESVIQLFASLYCKQQAEINQFNNEMQLVKKQFEDMIQRINEVNQKTSQLQQRQDAIYIPGQNKFAPMLQKLWTKMKRN